MERVLDGETIEIAGGTRILYIGVKVPEVEPQECFGLEAQQRNRQLVEGQWIEIEKDTSELDLSYGYLLRYVYLNGEMINEILIREGFGRASIQAPDVRFQARLLEAEEEARQSKRGVWGACPAS